jgi:hypothetical protein
MAVHGGIFVHWRLTDMMKALVALCALCATLPSPAWPNAELIEVACASCAYRNRFIQGSSPQDRADNIQWIIVVCERAGEIRSVRAPLDPKRPVRGEALPAKPNGTGVSKLLGMELPKFILPGNTCPLFPLAPYLESNVCPVDGRPGVQAALVESSE